MKIREIVLDTETTGLSPQKGDRLVEIGAIELINHLPTGRVFHSYMNPQREIPAAATRVHGITDEKVHNAPLFAQIVDKFLEFIEDSSLVIHNAAFDMGFLNAELTRLCRPALDNSRAIDTLLLARRRFPGSPASLDALCRRFGIDLSQRTHHGAWVDAELLAKVYLELIGGRQVSLGLDAPLEPAKASPPSSASPSPLTAVSFRQHPNTYPVQRIKVLLSPLSESDRQTHQSFIQGLKDPLWNKISAGKSLSVERDFDPFQKAV